MTGPAGGRISAPKGGGALSAIGETFQSDLHTGTGNLSIPIPLPEGRRGLTPSLTLAYSTGAGNGPFGLDWSLAVPRVARRTDTGVPRYDDTLDTFVLSGAEELVPVSVGSTAPPAGSTDTITRYRPRTEANFARITHVTGPLGDYWEVWSSDGLRSRYGTPIPAGPADGWADPAVIANPDGGIFAWLLAETVDPLGNRISYQYSGDGAGGPQRYLAEVDYADYGDTAQPEYAVRVGIVYDDRPRPDPFSDRRPGFELRTTLRAYRVEVWTPGATTAPTTTVTLTYADETATGAPSNRVSLLVRVDVTGQDGVTEAQALPPLEFGYSDWQPTARRFRLLTGELPPVPLGTGGVELIDLFGDGLPSALQLNGAVRYWRNRGAGTFDPPRPLDATPAGVALGTPGVLLTDLDGDGRAELVLSQASRTATWSLAAPADTPAARAGFDPSSYHSASVSTLPLTDPQVRLVDLNGDHRLDLLRSGAPGWCAFGDGHGGFTALQRLPPGGALPPLDFTDPRIQLADMTGDGLTDIVLTGNGRIQYWPNLGRGRFGQPITMQHSPTLPDANAYGSTGYDPRRLLLGDVVGDGAADVIYVGDGHVTIWVNQSGNGFAAPVTVPGTPRVSNLTGVRLADLTGSGVLGIVWSGVGPAGRYAFLDLTGGVKPYLLTSVDNHAGATTTIRYASSTSYATADRSAGRPWTTTLPFPVHVVASTVTEDAFAGTQLTAAFSYHDGYWDPIDREFRGFGRVEQTDTLAVIRPDPPAPTVLQPLDPLAQPSGVPAGLDPAAAGNLLANWSFDTPAGTGPTTLTTTPQDLTGEAGSAAAGWTVRNAAATTTTTELIASRLPYGAGGSMIHVDTGAAGCGLAQTFKPQHTGPQRVLSSVWVNVVRGSVRLATGEGATIAADAVCAETGRWMLVEAGNQTGPANTITILADDDGGAEFYVDHAWTREPAGPGDPVTSPPVRTVSWFHPGPLARPGGRWVVPDPTGQYWPGDPPLTSQIDTGPLSGPAGTAPPRQVLWEAIRALRGRLFRTELYADDGTTRADRPYEVHDTTYQLAPVLDGRSLHDPGWQAVPVVTVRPVLTRTAVWERGSDPMTRLQASGGYDDYGRAHAAVELGVARGRDPRAPGAACLATLTTTEHATRDDDDDLYLIDRVVRTARYEATDDGTRPVVAFAAAALAGAATGQLHALVLTYYDGPAFTGLDLGHLGDHGLPVRTEHLVITPDRLTQACQPGPTGNAIPAPPYLPLDGGPAPPDWPADYPAAFQQAIVAASPARGSQLGYLWHPDSAAGPAGYYAQSSRLCYDVQTGGGRGLVTVARDAYGGDTSTSYKDDPYQLLPTLVTDPIGLSTTAAYDYRVLKPALITDPNGNRTAVGYTPLGLLAWTAQLGKDGADEGDTIDQPGVRYDYHLTAWDDSAPTGSGPPGVRQPMSVAVTRRIDHRWTIVAEENARRTGAGQPPLTDAEIADQFGPNEPATHSERFARTVAFSDGFGRLLQTRTQADDLVVDDLGLPDDPVGTAGVLSAHLATPDAPAVVVSGWTVYDNKGRTIISYEPFLDVGYGYALPDPARLAGLARTARHYDPLGLCLRTVAADRSETLTIPGIPDVLASPTSYTPNPWETYTYDANDNAGRTHPTVSLSFATHWNTPASTHLDAFGRTVTASDRTNTGTLITTITYDIDGHPLAITDPLGRLCADTVYDLAGQPWRSWRLDAGTTHTIRDATGAVVEQRDDKTALTLAAFDPAHRSRYGWAADRDGHPPTLRLVTIYGDDPIDSGLTAGQARAVNALGRVVRTLDEAGQLTTAGYDLDGNPISVIRRVLRPDLLLAGLPAGGSSGQWAQTSYQVDWQPAGGETLARHAEPRLDLTAYTTDVRYDALGRTVSEVGPVDASGARARRSYSYGRGGGITAIALDDTPQLRAVAYDAHGRRLFSHLGNGVLVRYRYDPRSLRLTRLHSAHSTQPTRTTWQPNGPALQDHSYRHDPAGNLLILADRTPGCGRPPGDPNALDRRFGYDPLHRLVFASGRETDLAPDRPWLDTPRGEDPTKARGYTETYRYDAVGNLLELHHGTDTPGNGAFARTYTPANNSNRLATLTTGSFTGGYRYDACGNLTAETTSRLFEWDHANRLATYRTQAGDGEPSVYAQYRYDSTGSRVLKLVRKRNGAATTITVYLGGFERQERRTTAAVGTTTTTTTTHDILHVLDGAHRMVEIHRGDPLPDDPLASTPVRYTLADHLGSTTTTTDPLGTVLNQEEYTPYGETSFGSYAQKRYRFTGKERDKESSLHYHGARYYAPWLARWTSRDPLDRIHARSPYVYAANQPLGNVDPDGRQEKPAPSSPTVSSPTVNHASQGGTATTGQKDARAAISCDATVFPETCRAWEELQYYKSYECYRVSPSQCEALAAAAERELGWHRIASMVAIGQSAPRLPLIHFPSPARSQPGKVSAHPENRRTTTVPAQEIEPTGTVGSAPAESVVPSPTTPRASTIASRPALAMPAGEPPIPKRFGPYYHTPPSESIAQQIVRSGELMGKAPGNIYGGGPSPAAKALTPQGFAARGGNPGRTVKFWTSVEPTSDPGSNEAWWSITRDLNLNVVRQPPGVELRTVNGEDMAVISILGAQILPK